MAVTAETQVPVRNTVASGAVYLLGAQFLLLVAGYTVHAFLGRTLAPSTYGLFGVVMAFLTWIEVSLTGGFPYAIRKFGAEDSKRLPGVARTALRGQTLYAAALLVLALAAAPWLAGALGEPSLSNLIRLAALDIPVFAFYFAYIGILNGRRAFSRQSIAMALYATAKVVAILGLVLLGWGVRGALIGNILASVAGLAAAIVAVGRLGAGKDEPMKTVVGYAAGTAALGIVFTLLISIDIFFVKALVSDGNHVGFYVAATTLARAPFLLFLGIATAALPALSRATSTNDVQLARTYMSQALRLHLILLLPMTALVAGSASGMVALVYGLDYLAAGPVLSVAMLAFTLFGLTNALYNMLVASGETKVPLFSAILLVGLDSVLALWLIPMYGILGGAMAAACTAGLGLIIALWCVILHFGKPVDLLSVVKITFAAAVIYALSRVFSFGGLLLLVVFAGLGLLYFTMLVALREITRADWSKVLPIVGIKH